MLSFVRAPFLLLHERGGNRRCELQRACLFICTIGLLAGCDRAKVASSTTAPSRAPTAAASAPATRPAEAVVMLIDGQRTEFPPAKLRVKDRGDTLAAMLYSDDPQSALGDGKYAGNGFYFDMTLDVTDAKDLGSARWNFKAPSSEHMETVSGIFLEGRKYHLQPFDVTVEFDGNTSPVTVTLRGQFLMFDPQDETLPPRIVPAGGEFRAEMK
jgi:hypothetical protein